MRLEQFDYLDAIDKYNSMNKASENIFVSQQSISAAILELEQELGGVKLVYRTNKGSFLTPAGKELVTAKQEFMMKCADIVKEFRTLDIMRNESNELHLVMEYTLITYYEEIYLSYMQRHPDIKLNNTFMNYNEIDEQLRNCVDVVAILCLEKQNYEYFMKTYDCVTIKTLQLTLYVSKNSYLANNKTVSLSNIYDHQILIYSSIENPSSVARILQDYSSIGQNNTFLYNVTIELQKRLSKLANIAFFAMDNIQYDVEKMPFVKVELKEKIPMYLICAAVNREIPEDIIQILKMI